MSALTATLTCIVLLTHSSGEWNLISSIGFRQKNGENCLESNEVENTAQDGRFVDGSVGHEIAEQIRNWNG
jgi:hypothetical protein